MQSQSTQQHADAKLWIGYAFMLMGLFLMAMDISVSDVIVPNIVRALHIPVSDTASIVTTYLVITSSVIILLGKVSDIIGARRGFMIGITIFTLGSMVTGLAINLTMILAGRIVQAVGFALVAPSSISLLNHNFPGGPARTLAFSLWTAVIGSAMAIGIFLGGWITTHFSWRWVFLVNLPIAIAALAGVFLTIKPVLKTIHDKRIDYGGALLLLIGISLLVFGFQSGASDGWWQSTSPVSTQPFAWLLNISTTVWYILLGVIVAGLFCTRQAKRKRHGRSIILDMALLKNAHFNGCVLAMSLMTGTLLSIMVMIPLYASYVLDYNAFYVGLTLLPLGIGMAIGGPLMTWVLHIRTTQRYVQTLLFVQLITVGCLIPLLSMSGYGWWLSIPLWVNGMVWGATYSMLVNTSMAIVPKALSGLAGGLQLMGRLVAGALCTAIMTSIVVHYLDTQKKTLNLSGLTPTEVTQVMGLYDFSGQIHPKVVEPGMTIYQAHHIEALNDIIVQFKDEMVTATQQALVFAAIVNLLALLSGFWIRNNPDGITL